MRKLVRMITTAAAFAALARCCRRAGSLPKPQHQVCRSVRGRKRDRYARPSARQHVSQSLGQTVIDREHRRRQRHSGGAERGARRRRTATPSSSPPIRRMHPTRACSKACPTMRSPISSRSRKLGTITLALVGHPSVPANTVQELIAYAKANPGKLTFGSGSTLLARRRRTAEDHGRHRHAACALQEQSAGGDRPAGRPDIAVLRRHLDVAAASARRQAEGLCGVELAALAARARPSDAR